MSSDDRRFVEVVDAANPEFWIPKPGAEPFSIDYEAAEEALAAVSPANKANVSRLAVNAALGIGDTDE